MYKVLFSFFFFINTVGYSQWTEHIISTDGYLTLRILAVDIDKDSFIDVIFINQLTGTFFWCKNLDGTGTFGPPQEIGSINEPRYMSSGDLDGDGDMDLVGSSPLPSSTVSLVWYRNLDGLGTFSPAIEISSPPTNREAGIIIADMDGDGDNDLVNARIEDNALTWFENLDGNGTFGSPNIIASSYVNASAIDVADIDDDGDLDICVGTTASGNLAWFKNLNNSGNFASPIEFGNQSGVLDIHATDIDGDGDYDIVGAAPPNDIIGWWENLDGLGTFSSETIHINNTWDNPNDVFPVDLDNDNDIDLLAVYGPPPGYLVWFENLDGAGTFDELKIIANTVENAISVVAADIDNDGDMDPVTASQTNDIITWYENDLLSINENSQNIIKLYPNPVKNILTIESQEPIQSLNILDLLGRKLTTYRGAINNINISNMPPGLLFVEITNTEGKVVKKIIKE